MTDSIKKNRGRRTLTAAKAINTAFALLWAISLFIPISAFIFHICTGKRIYDSFHESVEKRHMNPPPDFKVLSPKEWGRAIEEWYNDRFAWRTETITFYRQLHFNVLKTYVQREVPGLDGWEFRHGGDWAELDDYLGGFELTEKEKENWVTLFEGRCQWAAAHDSVYLQLITSVKAQIQCEKIPFAIRRKRGHSVGAQIREALKGSPAEKHVVFIHDAMRAKVKKGQDMFYRVDHHPNGFGEFILYNELNERLRSFFPQVGPIRLGKGSGFLPECWITDDDRLAVSYPGSKNVEDSIMVAGKEGQRRPVISDRPGEGLYILMMNDSFMRFTLASWRSEKDGVRFPFGEGVDRVASFMFVRATTGFMETVMSERIPDVIIEQFPECRLNMNIVGFDMTMRRAAMFGRGVGIEEKDVSSLKSGRIYVRAVFENVVSDTGETGMLSGVPTALTAILSSGGRELARSRIYPGIKRAVFFEPVDAAEIHAVGGNFEVRIEGGSYSASKLKFSVIAEGKPAEP